MFDPKAIICTGNSLSDDTEMRGLRKDAGSAVLSALVVTAVTMALGIGGVAAKRGAQSSKQHLREMYAAQAMYSLSMYMDVNAPWPKFAKDNQNTGQGVGSGAIGVEKWSFQTGGQIRGGPVVGSDGTIYFGSNDGTIYAVNPDGSLKWSYQTGPGIVDVGWTNCAAPLVGNGVVFVEGGAYEVDALDIKTGQPKWTYLIGQGYLPVGLDSNLSMGANGLLYFDAYDIYYNGDSEALIALNSRTGQLA